MGCESLRNVDGLKDQKKLKEFIYSPGAYENFTSSLESIDILAGLKDISNIDNHDLDSDLTLSYTGVKDIDALSKLKQLEKTETVDMSGLSGSNGVIIQWKEDEKLVKLPMSSGTDTLRNPGLDLSNCINLKNIDSLKGFKTIGYINLSGCESLENLGALEGLECLSSLDLTGCVSLTDVSGIAGFKNLCALKMEGCAGVKIPPRPVNMKLKKEVEKYQARLFKAEGKPVPEYLKKSIQDRKEREAGVYDTFNKIKKLFRQGSFTHVKQGLELARSSGDPILFDYILEGISSNKVREPENDDIYDTQYELYRFLRVSYLKKGIYFIPWSYEIFPTGWIEANKVFKWTRTDYPYFIQAVLGLIAHAPPECKMAEHLKKEITGLSVILPENPDESYIDLQDTALLAGLKNLEYLELINCKSLMDLNGLSGLKRLRYLRFRDCGQLKGLEGLKDLPVLERIDLSGCTSLENVDALERIKKIEIMEIDLTDCSKLKDMKGLKSIKGLTTLEINDIQFENMDIFSELTQLKIIDLGSPNGSSKLKDLSGLSKMTKLVKLDLKGSTELETLYSSAGRQGHAGPRGLEGCRSLKRISLIKVKLEQFAHLIKS